MTTPKLLHMILSLFAEDTIAKRQVGVISVQLVEIIGITDWVRSLRRAE
jgi:hypothetical protein